MDEDLVLNIATTTPAQRNNAPKQEPNSKGKRNKYSISAKKERANNRNKGGFEYNLLPTVGQE